VTGELMDDLPELSARGPAPSASGQLPPPEAVERAVNALLEGLRRRHPNAAIEILRDARRCPMNADR
jgi:hypothetical protein